MAIHFLDKTVLITGGASGIGKIMGRMVLEKGAKNLIIWDLNEEAIAQLKKEFSHFKAKIIAYKIDVANIDKIQSTAQLVLLEVGAVDVLINNAGIVVGQYFHEHSHDDIEKSMTINAQALMHITLEFLPIMLQHHFGVICNICSSAGLISNPKMSVYAASKWAAVGWSDSLRLEMEYLKTGVSITTIMPFYISTGMFDGVKSRIIPILQPESAASRIIKSIERKSKMVAFPLPYWFIRLSQGILPLPIFDWTMRNIFGIYNSMNDFKGRIK